MERIEVIQIFLEDECEYFDSCVSTYFEFIGQPIHNLFLSDLRAFYDNEAKSWLPTPKKVNCFKLIEITNWRERLKSELKEFFYLSEYNREPEKYKKQIKMLVVSRDKRIGELISLIEKLLDEQYEVFELDVRLDGYYACYSKDYIFKKEKTYYLLRAQIHDVIKEGNTFA
ncbi:hypothetical protein [Paenibacillus sp. IHBB 10380]|uniref:hypothetical protein n=1 Tax=Paenibacillus sp. IHBB 10380 TaxID=1566358 RepID=UPI0005CFBE91|nr:hypothetical protein [Paenibacillus sp. IHBB 10380]AJS59319.1 hypothetical protein UB51_13520 [Paenibacillus sp. IHBB 10380]